MPFEVCLFWAPLVGIVVLAAFTGHQIRSAAAMPRSLSPAFFLCGALLAFGATVGIFKPARLERWFRPAAKVAWWSTSQHLFGLVLGIPVAVWAVMSLFRLGL
jgi:hypothetical protein